MTVMERFEVPGARARLDAPPPIDRRPPSAATQAAVPTPVVTATVVARAAAATTAARQPVAPDVTTDPADDDALTAWDAAAIVPPASSHSGLVAIGALAGSAAAVGVGAVVGWTGSTTTFAAMIGLDIGVLVGAAAGVVLGRHHARLVRQRVAAAGRTERRVAGATG